MSQEPFTSPGSGYKEYSVNRRQRQAQLDFIISDLKQTGCRILFHTQADRVPFRITFETRHGERLGIIVYPCYANTKLTRNRPSNEWRFQLKYGSKPKGRPVFAHLWQDPFGLYTTLLCGISPEQGFFVGADPLANSPTRLFISIEFKEEDVSEILRKGWHWWERDRVPSARLRPEEVTPEDVYGVQTMVGGTRGSFLRYVRFEREAAGEDPGHRALLAEHYRKRSQADLHVPDGLLGGLLPADADERHLHQLAEEFEMSSSEVLDLIAGAKRLKMAVRGWVAEHHLERALAGVPGVTSCRRLEGEGLPDIELSYRGSPKLSVECKNVLRKPYADGQARLDFQRTRASLADPCSRFYSPADFDVVAACMHAIEESWSFRYAVPGTLDPHDNCVGKLRSSVRIDSRWSKDAEDALRAAAALKEK